MTGLLEKAIAELTKLPDEEQDAIAAMILAELEDGNRWDDAFSASQDELSELAENVRQDIREDRVKKMGIDEL